MYGVLAPLAYAAFLIGSLLIFSKVYRKRQAKRAHREPWFGPHHARDIYVSLLSMDPPPPRNVLVSALVRRAMTDIQRVMEIRENKAALQNLLLKGQIGDDTWNHLLETEKEMDSELYEVVQEANHFRPGWGQYIFPHAGDMIQHEKNKKMFETIEEEKKKLAEKYGSNASPIHPTPILGLVGGKRSLPSTTPSNAQLPGSGTGTPSKPGTPSPAGALTPAQQQAALQQRAAMQQMQQMHAANVLRQQQEAEAAAQQKKNSASSPQSTPSKSAAQSKNNSPKATTSTSSSTSNTPAKGANGTNGAASPAPAMLRQASTATNESDADDDEEGDDATSGVGSPQGGNAASSGTKKTPSKKKNKKKKNKK